MDISQLLILILISIILTLILWKKGLLKVVMHYPQPNLAPGAVYDINNAYLDGPDAVFKVNDILEAHIPKWMGEPPISYTICFLIVCIGISVVILSLTALFKVI